MKRSRFTKLLVPVVCVLLFTALGGSAASAAAKGNDRPWKGKGLVTLTFNLDGTISGEGTVNVTHLGRSHYSNLVTCEPGGCFASGGSTVVTITAANGDMVFGIGAVAPMGGGTIVTLDGGTGRFAGATGNYVVGGPPPFVIDGVFFLEFTQTGTINY
jgi:hypothetical protein